MNTTQKRKKNTLPVSLLATVVLQADRNQINFWQNVK